MNFSSRLLLLPLTMLLTACAPFPHRVVVSPDIRGTLLDRGRPVAGAAIFFGNGDSNQAPCTQLAPAAVTDRDGNFSIAMRHQWRLFYAPLVEPLEVNLTSLCFQRNDSYRLGVRTVTWPNQSRPAHLACDFSAEATKHPGINQEPGQFCSEQDEAGSAPVPTAGK